MLRPNPPPRRRACGCSFLLAFLVAVASAEAAAKGPSQELEALDYAEAARLLIHVAKPDYPAVAKVNFIQGLVRLEVKVTQNGHVSETHVVDGEPILAVAAIDAVRKWLYRPYFLRESPVPFKTYVVVKFRLHTPRFKGPLPRDSDNYLERQVRPPEVIFRPQQVQSASSIQMKVLVGSKGEIVDATSPKAGERELDLARKNLQLWKFRPARWGSMAVPWYITVTVPLDRDPLDQLANSAKH